MHPMRITNPLTGQVVVVPVLDGDAESLTNPRNRVEGMKAERRVVALLISHLASKGFTVHSVSDGEERHKVATTTKEAMEVIFSVDDSRVFFGHPNLPKRHVIYIILGNADDGSEVAADYSVGDGFDTAIDELFDALQ